MANNPLTNLEKSRLELQEIQKLIKMIERSPITEFELVEKDLRIRISKNGHANGSAQMVNMPTGMPVAQMQMMQPTYREETPSAVSSAKPSFVEVKCPMVGTFYRTPAPDADAYIRVGDYIESSPTSTRR